MHVLPALSPRLTRIQEAFTSCPLLMTKSIVELCGTRDYTSMIWVMVGLLKADVEHLEYAMEKL